MSSTMTLSTTTMGGTTTMERATWTCPNCQTETRAPRKRCTECRTSRY